MFLLAGWISRQQLIVIEYLKAENRMMRERLNGHSLRFTDKERALLARCQCMLLEEHFGAVPYLPAVRVPYYLFIGRSREAQ